MYDGRCVEIEDREDCYSGSERWMASFEELIIILKQDAVSRNVNRGRVEKAPYIGGLWSVGGSDATGNLLIGNVS